MTSTTDTNAHPDVIEIADLAEGILSTERAAEVRTHIDSCAQCADVLASLQEISGLLGGLPEPEPMPLDIAQRIDAALAAESRPGATQPDVPRETPRPPSTPRFHADVPRGTSAPAGRSTAPTGPGRGAQRRRRLLLAAASCAAILALGGLTYQLATQVGTVGAARDAKSSGAKVGSDASVADDVARLLTTAPGAKTGTGGPDNSPMVSGNTYSVVVTAPDGTVTPVPTCVLKATQRTDRPLAAERDRFQGVDSYLVVLPDPADSDRVDAVVVTASCTAAAPGRVLFQNSYPRG